MVDVLRQILITCGDRVGHGELNQHALFGSTLARRASEEDNIPRWRVGLRCCNILHGHIDLDKAVSAGRNQLFSIPLQVSGVVPAAGRRLAGCGFLLRQLFLRAPGSNRRLAERGQEALAPVVCAQATDSSRRSTAQEGPVAGIRRG